MAVEIYTRRLSAGVEVQGPRAHARVWAPACRSIDVVLEPRASEERRTTPLAPEGDGYFSASIGAAAGDRYWFRLDGDRLRPDPASRFQPEGPHGPSAIVDPSQFRWRDANWSGVTAVGQVLYEMHIGTFTQEGTWRAAAEQLPHLADLGVTVVEMMPVADFAGRFGWGYDGVALYAPTRLYGEPDDLRAFVDRAHALFHAVHRYAKVTGEMDTVRQLLPRLADIVRHHLAGTRFGIGVDPTDGLLKQGAEGYQLTWMDAKVDDWVVTPRRGKAVEINALWYNALRLLQGWSRELGGDIAGVGDLDLTGHAERARRAFNERFWFADGGYLFDVVDGPSGNDAALRPNQILAFSLEHPVLDRSRWAQVLDVVREKLLTPVGLRSLAPGHPDYKPTYYGDLRSRDAAYHQGTVWAWLIGPYLDAWLKVHPGDDAGVQDVLRGFEAHLSRACVGSIGEIFDAEEPYTPRGCVAQAWSVAEVLRHLR